jgi:hypothetical protein
MTFADLLKLARDGKLEKNGVTIIFGAETDDGSRKALMPAAAAGVDYFITADGALIRSLRVREISGGGNIAHAPVERFEPFRGDVHGLGMGIRGIHSFAFNSRFT